ncbi:MAG TPA: 50S ribosomal protein L24 [Nitrososphaerales archaeon]|nr:50S ribosomal protein L24 [Nitrososphaerales archaeon]
MKFASRLSDELREKYGRKSLRPKTGDSVRIVRGEFLGVEGKVTKVFSKDGRLNVEGVSREKMKGGTASVPIESSNVVLTALNLDDKRRKAKLEEQG